MKKKAAFVDHSFHKKTLCTVFLKELLSKTFELVEYYDESWNGGNEINIDLLKDYEYIFYFQYIHKIKEFKKLNVDRTKIVWFPMWDGVVGIKNSEWIKYQAVPMKIACFSRTLYNKLSKLGFDCEYFQYYIDPQSIKSVTDYNSKRIYFWNRTEEINWKVVKKILGETCIDALTFMAVPDPNQNPEFPLEEDLKQYNIQYYDQFLDYEKYINIVSKSNIYIAPRKFEGIGMSFLEALCRGQCVIAPNLPTMNEYITHGVNGYLYNLDDVEEIDISKFNLVGEEARNRAIDGFKSWQQQKIKLVEYITMSNDAKKNTFIDIFSKFLFFKFHELSNILINK